MDNNCSECGATIGDGKTICSSCANKRKSVHANCTNSYCVALRKNGH